MSFSKLVWLKGTDGHKFTGAEIRVLLSIYNHSDAHGRNSHPGLKRMMAETCYGKAAVSTAVSSLKARGWICETRKGSGVSGNASVFELVHNAPIPPSSSPGGEQPREASSSPAVEQPSEVVRLERTSSSPGANQVVRLEQYPSDPDIRSGSDPFGSDQEEVRYSPNHLEDQDETGLEGRSLAVGGRTAATPTAVADWPAGPATATEGATGAPEDRPAGLQPPTAGSPSDDPFASEPAWRAESAGQLPQPEWQPSRRTATSRRPRSFAERVEALQQ